MENDFTSSSSSMPAGQPGNDSPVGAKTSNSDAYKFLISLPEFSQLPTAEIKLLAESSRFANYEARGFVSSEGQESGLYGFIVVSGCLAMTKTSPSGKELIVELLQAGDIFGMLLSLAAERLPYQLSARTIKKSSVLWVPLTNFDNLLRTNPILFKDYVAHLLICLQSSYRLARGLAHDRVEVRIAAVISSLAMKFSKQSPDQSYTVQFTRQQIADLTGTTPETAIRVTRQMQRDQIIDIKKPGMIRIVDLESLQEIAEV